MGCPVDAFKVKIPVQRGVWKTIIRQGETVNVGDDRLISYNIRERNVAGPQGVFEIIIQEVYNLDNTDLFSHRRYFCRVSVFFQELRVGPEMLNALP